METTEQGSIAWVVRRAVYVLGAVIGVGLVASGRVTQEQIDTWVPLATEVGGALVTAGFALAAWRTGPHSDNSRPVLPVEQLDELFVAIERIADQAGRLPNAENAEAPAPVEVETEPVPTMEAGDRLDDLRSTIHD